MEKNPVGMRKGAWTKDEDVLLTKCVEKYGEGKWHQVPVRAGLNRCRKSCRLRWLNYLRPNLKRGYFTKDEVDLIVRLHKLLGNRWSLIAGRLPGRTANDVKNFWNTHIGKKSPPAGGESCRGSKTITESNIIRPRPRTFSKLQVPACPNRELPNTKIPNDEYPKNMNPSSLKHWATHDDENPKSRFPSPSSQEDECIQWWGNLLELIENGEGTPFLFSDEDQRIMEPMFSPGTPSSINQDGFCSLSLDVDVWELVHFDGQ